MRKRTWPYMHKHSCSCIARTFYSARLVQPFTGSRKWFSSPCYTSFAATSRRTSRQSDAADGPRGVSLHGRPLSCVQEVAGCLWRWTCSCRRPRRASRRRRTTAVSCSSAYRASARPANRYLNPHTEHAHTQVPCGLLERISLYLPLSLPPSPSHPLSVSLSPPLSLSAISSFLLQSRPPPPPPCL